MSKRWKPNDRYYYVCAGGVVDSYPWRGDDVDKAYYEFGNCFETEEQAKDAATKIRELLLSMAGEGATSSDQLPKLTVEVFNRPDCPEWAKYAVVNADGKVVLFPVVPSIGDDRRWRATYYTTSALAAILDDETFDATDWENSLVERPEKSLPKLTEEVFSRPDCPEWAKIAVVNRNGEAYYGHDNEATINSSGGWCGLYDGQHGWERIGNELFDASDWKTSMIERPAKLPDWCKVDAIGWHKRCGYFKVTYIDDVSKRVDIQQVEDGERGYLSYRTVCNEVHTARLRPWTFEEVPKIPFEIKSAYGEMRVFVSMAYYNKVKIGAEVEFTSNSELAKDYLMSDDKPCGVLEHLENGEWVK